MMNTINGLICKMGLAKQPVWWTYRSVDKDKSIDKTEFCKLCNTGMWYYFDLEHERNSANTLFFSDSNITKYYDEKLEKRELKLKESQLCGDNTSHVQTVHSAAQENLKEDTTLGTWR